MEKFIIMRPELGLPTENGEYFVKFKDFEEISNIHYDLDQGFLAPEEYEIEYWLKYSKEDNYSR